MKKEVETVTASSKIGFNNPMDAAYEFVTRKTDSHPYGRLSLGEGHTALTPKLRLDHKDLEASQDSVIWAGLQRYLVSHREVSMEVPKFITNYSDDGTEHQVFEGMETILFRPELKRQLQIRPSGARIEKMRVINISRARSKSSSDYRSLLATV